jgi:hypothetical protein
MPSLFAWVISPNANNVETTAERKHAMQAHSNVQHPNWESAVLCLSINETPATSNIFFVGKQPITSSNLLQPTRTSSIISSNLPLPSRTSSMMSSNLYQPARTSSAYRATSTYSGREHLYLSKQHMLLYRYLPIQAGISSITSSNIYVFRQESASTLIHRQHPTSLLLLGISEA